MWWLKYVESVYSIIVYIIFCNYVNLYINMFKRKKELMKILVDTSSYRDVQGSKWICMKNIYIYEWSLPQIYFEG